MTELPQIPGLGRGRSRLITDPNEQPRPHDRRASDARHALAVGLADYLEGVTVNAPGGRQAAFKRVLPAWADPEQVADYPSAVVTAGPVASYDASKFQGTPTSRLRIPGTDKYLVSACELVVDLSVEMWATDAVERGLLVAAVEEAMNPVDFMYGFRLELPHYFNERAEYEFKQISYVDTEEDAQRRYRRAVALVAARVAVTRVFVLPVARPRARVAAVGTDVLPT